MLTAWLRRLAALQNRRPLAMLLVVTAISALALWSASSLRVEGGFEHLLPDGRPSVAEYRRVTERTAGVSTLFIVLEIEGGGAVDPATLRAAGDALVADLRLLGEPFVGDAENGVHDAVAFMEPRAGLYASLEDLQALRQVVAQRWEYEVQKGAGLLLDEHAPPPALDEATIRALLQLDGATARDRFPDGYFQSADGRALAVVVRSKIPSSDAVRGREALARIREVVERADLHAYDPRIRHGFAGDLYSGVVEVSALDDDLTHVGLLGASLIAGVVLLFYLRARTLFVMLATLFVGLAWTAGLARLAVDNLSIGTSFVFTIIAGTGLNTSVIYLARTMEVRRRGGSVEESLFVAHRETLGATCTACAASAASFLALMSTAFRGFRELGLIGAIGLVSCWVATLVCLPALLAALERVRPMLPARCPPATGWSGGLARARSRLEGGFGKPFARLVAWAPGPIAVTGLAIAAVGALALVHYVRRDPMEYDLSRLRNDLEGRAAMVHDKELADALTGYVGADGMAILVDRPEQVGPLRDALHRIRDEAAPAEKPFASIHALEDFVPPDQARKIPVLLDIASKLRRMRARGGFSEEDWARLSRFLPSDDLRPITMADLPPGISRPFTETDGTRGRVVYIRPIDAWIERSETLGAPEDARYLLRWAASYRETKLPDQSIVLGSGRAVIYADMVEGVQDAIPTATLAAIGAVVLVTALAFGWSRRTLYVLGSLGVGVGWMALALVVLDVKLNFLDFVALPLTLGIGVEYAVNIVHRYGREGRGNVDEVLRETGGAVVLCSATTILGYAALAGSINGAVRSLGLVAVIGEVCTLLSAMLVLPAFLTWIDARRGSRPGLLVQQARQASSSV